MSSIDWFGAERGIGNKIVNPNLTNCLTKVKPQNTLEEPFGIKSFLQQY